MANELRNVKFHQVVPIGKHILFCFLNKVADNFTVQNMDNLFVLNCQKKSSKKQKEENCLFEFSFLQIRFPSIFFHDTKLKHQLSWFD